MGTFIRNIALHVVYVIMRPPSTIPRTDPAPHTIEFMPKARPLSCGGNAWDISAKEFAVSSAAPMPCIPRKTTRSMPLGARPESAEPIMKTTKPALYMRFLP